LTFAPGDDVEVESGSPRFLAGGFRDAEFLDPPKAALSTILLRLKGDMVFQGHSSEILGGVGASLSFVAYCFPASLEDPLKTSFRDRPHSERYLLRTARDHLFGTFSQQVPPNWPVNFVLRITAV